MNGTNIPRTPRFLPVCLLLLASAAAAQAAQPAEGAYNPVANPQAVVVFGNARFTVLTSRLIRMEWAADGKFEDHASLVFLNRRLPVPAFKQERNGRTLIIDTGNLRLRYRGDARFSPDNLQITFSMNGNVVTWHPGMPDTGNLLGTTRTLDGALGSKTAEPIGPGLISREGWALVDDSSRPLFDSDDFAFKKGEQSPWPWLMPRPAGDRLDWYFFGYGHDYKQALQDFVQVAGRIPLLPRWAFGNMWTRYWAYSDQEIDSLVRGFRENDTPLDVMVIDMNWHKTFGLDPGKDQAGQRKGWTGFSWDRQLFPDPPAFLENLHREGLKVAMNLHPASGIQPWEDKYPEMARAMGIDPASKRYVPFDVGNKKYVENLFKLVLHPLEKEGVDFWWIDWQQGNTMKIPGVDTTWWLNYVHFTDQEREGKRPLIFGRWGGLGNHRYPAGFSGDVISAWPSLVFQPWFTATSANVGFAYWTHDIGGHMPGPDSPELYTRWIQFGAFSPILRTHTTKNPKAERRIWAFPEPYSGIMRDAVQHRYALIPYIYTEARRTYDTGLAFLHPLYYDWPEAEQAYQNKDEYVFGSEMVVAPVTRPVDPASGLASESVWIPNGRWIETATGTGFTGPKVEARSFSISQIPVYVRAGAILPMQPPMLHTGQRPVDPLIVRVYPSAEGETSSYKLYEDGGDSEAYRHGACAWTELSAKQSGDTLTVTVAPISGEYPGMLSERSYRIELPGGWPPESVRVNGEPLKFAGQTSNETGWRYEGNRLMTVVNTPSFSVHARVTIEIQRAAGSFASRSELNGFAGAITRLHEAHNALNDLFPLVLPPDALTEAWQTGDRLKYRPQTARRELGQFPGLYSRAIAAVELLTTESKAPDAELNKRLALLSRRSVSEADLVRYRAGLNQALALLKAGQPDR